MPEEGRRAPKAYDATLKHLVEARPTDWLAYLGMPIGSKIEAVDADLSSSPRGRWHHNAGAHNCGLGGYVRGRIIRHLRANRDAIAGGCIRR
jgi:hypothetical protein